MLASIFVLLADAQEKAPAPEGGGSGLQSIFQSPFTILPLIMLIGYFLLWRPFKRQEAERQALLSKMKKNDEILTTGGIYATIIEVSDKEDKITVKIADNVRIKIAKAAIARNITNEEDIAKAKQQPAPTTKEGAAT
jgi:preprotein translocase subunit YajC